MKTIILCIIFLALLSFNTSNKTEINSFGRNQLEKQDSIRKLNNVNCIPDSNSFYLKRIKKTLGEKEILIFKELKPVTKIQAEAWVSPILGKSDYGVETCLLSFQNKTEKYYSFLIVYMFDIGMDLEGNEEVGCDQYFITVDAQGKYISSIKVFDNNRTDDRDEENPENNYDKEIGAYRMFNDIKSEFRNDTINLFELIGFKKDLNSKQQENYWKANFVTKYLINSEGKIECVKSRSKEY